MNKFYINGLDSLKNKDYENAFIFLTKALESAVLDDIGFIYEKLGFSLNKLSRFEDALVALEKACAMRPYYKTAVEICIAHAALGDWDALDETMSTWIDNERFLIRAQSCFDGGVPLNISLKFYRHADQISSNKLVKTIWSKFIQENKKILYELSDSGNNIVFSKKFPMFLSTIETFQLQKILEYSNNGAFIYWHHDSHDVMKKAAFETKKNYYNNFPRWLYSKISKESTRLVIDSSEEAPSLDHDILHTYFLKLFWGAKDLKITLLTANSIVNNKSDNLLKTLQYNIYPILAYNNNSHLIGLGYKISKFKKSFTLMIGLPRSYRLALLILLKRNNLINNVIFSWFGNENNKATGLSIESQFNTASRNYPLLSLNNSDLNWLLSIPVNIVPETDDGQVELNSHYLYDTINCGFFQEGSYHVVLETDFNHKNKMRMTEKTIKPLILGIPFLVCGPCGFVDFLRNIGIDLFDDYIDHSYDSIQSPEKRMQAIVNEMIRITAIVIPERRVTMANSSNTETIIKYFDKMKESFNSDFFNSRIN